MKKIYPLIAALFIQLVIVNAQTVSGDVADSIGNPVNIGTVTLFELQLDSIGNLYPTGNVVAATNLSGGAYSFAGIPLGYYLVLANPDDTLYPTALSTYYGNGATYSAAQPLLVDSFGATANIIVIVLAPLSGTGTFNGIVQYGVGTGKTGNGNPHPTGDPVPGIDISLEQIPGGIKAHATTDASGTYSIANIPLNTSYKLLIDIPGLPMDSSYSVTLTGGNTTANGLDFVVDTASDGTAGIYVGWPLSTKEFGIQDSEFRIYPNPNNGKFQATSPNQQTQSITIYNILGEEVHQLINSSANQLIDISNQPNGIYFITIKSGENNYYQKLIKQ